MRGKASEFNMFRRTGSDTPPMAAGGKTLARGHVASHFHNCGAVLTHYCQNTVCHLIGAIQLRFIIIVVLHFRLQHNNIVSIDNVIS